MLPEFNMNVRELTKGLLATFQSDPQEETTDGGELLPISEVPEVVPEENEDASNQRSLSQNIVQSYSLKQDVQKLNKFLQSHIADSARQFAILKDEIASIKVHLNRTSRGLVEQIEEVSKTTAEVNSSIVRTSSDINRRLQSISDQVKLLSTRSNKIVNNSKEHEVRQMQTESISGPRQETAVMIERNRQASMRPEVVSRQPSPAQYNHLHAGEDRNSHATDRPNNTTKRFKTLLIGDSIIKGIQKKGLKNDVDVLTLPGRKAADIRKRLLELDLSTYKNIIIYVGGNDAADKSTKSVYGDLKETINALHKDCKLYLCTVCPRSDTDVNYVNGALRQLTEETAAELIDCYQSFVYGDGSAVGHFYGRDGIHQCKRGSSQLVTTINARIPIIKERQPSPGAFDSPRRSPGRPHVRGFQNRQASGFHRRQTGNARWSRDGRPVSQPRISRWRRCYNCGLYNHATDECRNYPTW